MTLKDRFAYYTECQLATVEYLESLKRTSKSDLKRHKDIANQMIQDCLDYGITTQESIKGKLPRLTEILLDKGF